MHIFLTSSSHNLFLASSIMFPETWEKGVSCVDICYSQMVLYLTFAEYVFSVGSTILKLHRLLTNK